MSDDAIEGTIEPTGTVVDMADPHSGAHALGVPDDVNAFLFSKGTGGDLAEDDPYRRIIQQVLSAASPDVVLTPVEAYQAKDIQGRRLLLFGHTWNKSEFDAGTPMYASMECQDADTHESMVVNTGHKKMMAQLIKLEQFGKYPYEIQIRARGQSAQGTPMLELVKWDKRETEAPPF